jgi:hypothetical protein
VEKVSTFRFGPRAAWSIVDSIYFIIVLDKIPRKAAEA